MTESNASTWIAARRRGTTVLAVLLVIGLAAILPGRADAVAAPDSIAASAWMAGQVQPDGSVIDPYSTLPSVGWSVNVALGLAATGSQPVALARAMGYIQANVSSYVNGGTSDVVGRNSFLVLLAHAVGANPRAFGTTATDLVSAIESRYEVTEPGLYGTIDEYTPVTNQSLAILALTAAGEPVPAGALQWLADQQCSAPVSSVGAWEGYRGPSGGGLIACDPSSSSIFTSPESNSTSMAVQALAAAGSPAPIASALTWLHSLQVTSGQGVGGFGQWIGDPGDPNSTALASQMITAAGEDATSASWTVGGVSAFASLAAWQIQSGAEAGAVASPWSSGFADLYATYQAVWGLVPTAFPFAAQSTDPPVTVPVTPPTDTPTSPTVAVVTPRFTG